MLDEPFLPIMPFCCRSGSTIRLPRIHPEMTIPHCRTANPVRPSAKGPTAPLPHITAGLSRKTDPCPPPRSIGSFHRHPVLSNEGGLHMGTAAWTPRMPASPNFL